MSRKAAARADREKAYRHRLLCFEILKHRCLYYCCNAPELTDAEYDELERRLKAFERRTGVSHPESPTKTVGSDDWASYPALVRAEARQSLIRRGLWRWPKKRAG